MRTDTRQCLFPEPLGSALILFVKRSNDTFISISLEINHTTSHWGIFSYPEHGWRQAPMRSPCTICIFLLRIPGRSERTPKTRFYPQLCLGLRTPSLPCLCDCVFDRFPRGLREPASDGRSAVRASRSLAPPTSAATPNLRDICWGTATRTFYFLWSWKFV